MKKLGFALLALLAFIAILADTRPAQAAATDEKASAPSQNRESGVPPETLKLYAQALVAEARAQNALSELRRALSYLKDSNKSAADISQVAARLDDRLKQVQTKLQIKSEAPDLASMQLSELIKETTGISKEAGRLLEEAATTLGKSASAESVTSPTRPWHLDGPRFVLRVNDVGHDLYGKDEGWDAIAALGFDATNARFSNYRMDAMSQESGKFDFSPLDQLIEVNAKHGYKTDVGIESRGFPDWFVAQHKDEQNELYFLGNDEKPITGGVRGTANIWNPAVVAHLEENFRATAEHCSNDGRVTMYELLNEPNLRGAGGPVGYGKYAQQAFSNYLAKKYGGIDELNRKWKTTYKNFEEIQPPKSKNNSELKPGYDDLPAPLLYEFHRFRLDSFVAYFEGLLSALHSGDADGIICSQWTTNDFAEWSVGEGLDLYKLFQLRWDLLGKHEWIGGGPALPLLLTYSYNRYAGHPLWQDEFIFTWWDGRDEKIEPNDEDRVRARVARNVFRQLVWGKLGLTFFVLDEQWRDWDNSILQLRPGEKPVEGERALNFAVDRRPIRYCAGVIPVEKEKLKRAFPMLLDSSIVGNGIGVIQPSTSMIVSTFKRRGDDFCRYLLAEQVVPWIVPEEAILDGKQDLKEFRVLAVSGMTHVPDGLVEKLLAWVRNGGTLICHGPLGQFDPYGQPLEEFAKAVWQGSEFPKSAETVSVGQGKVIYGPADAFDQLRDRLMQESRPLARLRCDLPTRMVTARDITGQIAGTIGPPIPISSVEIVERVDSHGEHYLCVLNLETDREIAPTVEVKGEWAEAREITALEPLRIPVTKADGWTKLSLPLAPGEGVVLRLIP